MATDQEGDRGRDRDRGRSVAFEITGVAGGGDGVGRLDDGRVAFVPRTAPGDQVLAEIVHDGGRWVRARLLELTARSPQRRQPPCPLYERCGGCQLQHLAYRHQLDAKAQMVAEALAHIGGRSVALPPVEPSPHEFHYRNRVSFTLRRLRGGRVVAGFHERERPARVLDVDERCLLPEAPILSVWRGLRAAWGSGAGRLPAGGELRVTLRAAGKRVILAVEGGEADWRDGAVGLMDDIAGLAGVWHRPSGRDWRQVAGDEALSERWHGDTVPVGPSAFVQVNREAAAALHLAVLREIGGPRGPRGLRVVDAYAGLAAYGRRLAWHGAAVTALELEPEAVAVARRDAPAGLAVVHGRVEDTLADALPADRVIVNPPRTGLDERVSDVLRKHLVGRLVYVSCDPATLARDLARLGEAYEVRRVQCFDLFPQTAHVETVATLDAVHASMT